MKRLLAMLTPKRVLIALFLVLEVSGLARAKAGASHLADFSEGLLRWLMAMPEGTRALVSIGIIGGGGVVFIFTAWLLAREIIRAARWIGRKLKSA
jgi:hypothetical protein